MNIEQSAERVTIGKIVKTRGLRGEVKVLPLSDVPERFARLDAVEAAFPDGRVLSLEIEESREQNGAAYLSFAGYDSMDAAQMLVGCLLQVKQGMSPTLPDGVFYQYEILGAAVYTDSDEYLGQVTEILDTGGHDVYVVRHDEREYLLPATAEIVRQIDRDRRRIVVHPIAGLLDL